ncbi:MAG: hypothetical protein ACFFFH_19465, partial [Candidatus Thorarchaeota archaeon]
MRLRIILPIIAVILITLSTLIGLWLFLSPTTSNIDSVFPLEIQGGTLVKFDSTRKEAQIINQGFNLTLLNDPVNVNQSIKYSVIIFNIQTNGLVVLGLENFESFKKLNETCVLLNVKSNSLLERKITLFIDTTGIDSYKIAV